ncbi:hypothetical protein HY251_19490, partial [bacterium]|nr:hypothetical protein [bacterium]
ETPRKKLPRAVAGAGVVAIVLAIAIVAVVSRPKSPVVSRSTLSPPVAVGEVRPYEESWSEEDPPAADLRARLDGEPTDLVRAADERIARVEWVVPDTRAVAHFLVHGRQAGQTTFEVRKRSGSSRVYTVVVEGSSKHERLRRSREEKLALLTSVELKEAIRKRISQGEALETLENAPHRERFPRRALHEYERAEEALERLRKIVSRQGDLEADLGQISDSVKEHADRAREVFRRAREFEKLRYDHFVRREQWDDAGKELSVLLSLLGDHCEGDFQRSLLLLEKWYRPKGHVSGNFEDPGCIEESE